MANGNDTTGMELAVKQANIDAYTGATKASPKPISTGTGTGTGTRKLADWEHVNPPSGRKYTTSGTRSGTKRVSKGRRKRVVK